MILKILIFSVIYEVFERLFNTIKKFWICFAERRIGILERIGVINITETLKLHNNMEVCNTVYKYLREGYCYDLYKKNIGRR